MKRKKLPVWTVRWARKKRAWVLRGCSCGPHEFCFKRTAVRCARDAFPAEYTRSVRIYGKNGRIQEERTYPRNADPRRSRG